MGQRVVSVHVVGMDLACCVEVWVEQATPQAHQVAIAVCAINGLNRVIRGASVARVQRVAGIVDAADARESIRVVTVGVRFGVGRGARVGVGVGVGLCVTIGFRLRVRVGSGLVQRVGKTVLVIDGRGTHRCRVVTGGEAQATVKATRASRLGWVRIWGSSAPVSAKERHDCAECVPDG